MPAASLSDEGTYAFWSDQADLKGPQHDLTSGFLCSFFFGGPLNHMIGRDS